MAWPPARTTVSASALTSLHVRDAGSLRSILHEVAGHVPAGHGPQGIHQTPQIKSINEIYSELLPVPGLPHPAPPDLVAAKAELSQVVNQAPLRLGTLGGGHHFLEFQADAEDHVWIVAHSGSRGLGPAICSLYDGLAARQNQRWHSWIPDRPLHPGTRVVRTQDIAYLPSESGDGQSFLKWATFCLAFGAANRARLIAAAEALLFTEHSGSRITYIDTPHTFVELERLNGRAIVVHRKGAARSVPGTLACIAGSARTGNWIVEGLGDTHTLSSIPHGAGHPRSTNVKDTRDSRDEPLTRAQVQASLVAARDRTLKNLDAAGIEVATPDDSLLLGLDHNEPSPPNQFPSTLASLARPVHRLRPLGVYRT